MLMRLLSFTAGDSARCPACLTADRVWLAFGFGNLLRAGGVLLSWAISLAITTDPASLSSVHRWYWKCGRCGERFRGRPEEKVPSLHIPHCPQCGYNLTANVSGKCPECGRAIGSEDSTARVSGAPQN